MHEFTHQLPRARVVDRAEYLREIAHARQVIHLGFVDEGRMNSKRAQESWLHEQLSTSASELVGIDSDSDGVALARKLGFAAYVADCQDAAELAALPIEPADVVVAGELIEHLDQPGALLEAVKCLVAPEGLLVITTPNAARLTNFVGAITNREFVNADHVGWFSWRVLKTMLERHGWALREFAYYAIPPTRHGLISAARTAVRPLFSLRPALSDGLIAVASPSQQHAPTTA
jgi:SAM-dependent methyltransferase